MRPRIRDEPSAMGADRLWACDGNAGGGGRGERDDELADQIAAGLIALLGRAEGDGHVDAHGQAVDGFPAAAQQLAQAVGGDGQQHVVDLRVVPVGDLLDLVEGCRG
jgi:hypothetical protein